MMVFLLVTFYVAMVVPLHRRCGVRTAQSGAAGAQCACRRIIYCLELHDLAQHRVPGARRMAGLALLKTGGPEMLRMMNRSGQRGGALQ